MFLPDEEPGDPRRAKRAPRGLSSAAKPRSDDCFRPFDFPDMPAVPKDRQFTADGFKRTTPKE